MNPSTSSSPTQRTSVDRYLVIAVSTTTDEHGVYVTKDSAEVIELGWILLDAKTLEEVQYTILDVTRGFHANFCLHR
jgi:hypothetical protein